jgi:hypothetical protein
MASSSASPCLDSRILNYILAKPTQKVTIDQRFTDLSMSTNSDPSPVEARDMTDPGDIVLSKFGYQFGYGVILLAGMLTKRLPYCALWCEQHEDFLAERGDGRFDAFQVKTRTADAKAGKWETNDEAFVKSVARFVDLDVKFPDQVAMFKFVSNMGYSDSSAKDREMFSPLKMLSAVLNVADWQVLPETVKKGFEALVKSVSQRPEVVFGVLKRTDLVAGRSRCRAVPDSHCCNRRVPYDDCGDPGSCSGGVGSTGWPSLIVGH